MKTENVTINFGGFYNTWHEDCIERAVAMMLDCDDHNTGEIDSDKLHDTATAENWQQAHKQYCIEYINKLNEKLDTEIIFKSLDSPREYNFKTDVILADIAHKDSLKLFEYIKENDLKSEVIELIEQATTSRDGYSPFYDYADFFMLENRDLLLTCLLDAIITELNEDYPFMVDEFYL